MSRSAKTLFLSLVFTAGASVSLFAASGEAREKEKLRFTLVQINKRAYLSFANLRRVHADLIVTFDKNEGQGELRMKKRVILFRLDEAQYQSQSELRELDDVGAIEDDGIFFSREFVEEILTELSVPVSYRFNRNNLLVVRDKPRDATEKLDFIFIDAGHGGKDSGALGYFDVNEKDITLTLAHTLKAQLKADFPGVNIYMTRSGDRFIRLEKRSDLANRRSDKGRFGIFVSIHCNSTLSPRVKGFEVYYLAQNPDNTKSRQLMLRENLKYESSAYIRKLTSQLMNAQIQRESKTLARQVFSGMANRLDGMIKPRKVKKADFAVLRGSLMPAILIETGYLTNKDDLKRLNSVEYRKAFAEGVSRGIGVFLSELAKAER
ncbi:N-acetylmuramoyl-L-alanine amidase family protein [Turneriella parva]|uniref:N-acetylmuramoyl-L-alanine amidase n=1 Tax=Turneriella parva (strain ATCC BAA-1111 / DSM 21527 / NCTC 11395 / H) TaxID=869212 RepID=I4BBA2_TURPD|nr:N-acetylmuramoyl-L-alanine amidase [Turneriella parva]AFM14559.1 cell wall hydrolase/autolysin [Turneriella parva DSM 21527]